jgi:uncharacterized protein YjbI with pentapeptide repeats
MTRSVGLSIFQGRRCYKLTRQAILTNTGIRRINLSGAKLSGTALRGLDFQDANLGGADLSRSDLSDAIMTGLSLVNARLESTVLTNADLRGANMSMAVLTGADLRGTDLRGARGLDTTNVTKKQLLQAVLDADMVLNRGVRADIGHLAPAL